MLLGMTALAVSVHPDLVFDISPDFVFDFVFEHQLGLKRHFPIKVIIGLWRLTDLDGHLERGTLKRPTEEEPTGVSLRDALNRTGECSRWCVGQPKSFFDLPRRYPGDLRA